ncbi:hypothetical protein [Luteibacter yeojuensis]|uniref:Uncharacterized protein n=1 Tax=Luteibacter yeojuensis TaxID=345309 RepID=A0A0F3L1E2_9GAMM|nr:hypothetical protein [Luteibacter yeojuensis]KJV37288.1 hypothetical protein VI08_00245 [Luteibacter yeojuensis]
MSDSIDLLEAVGRDASLRRLPPDLMASALREAGATDALAEAATTGDPRALAGEFGARSMMAAQTYQTPYRDIQAPFREDEEGEGEREGEDQPVPRDPEAD